MMKNKRVKTINGHCTLVIRRPLEFDIDVWDETYMDKNGKEYVEEDYEYGIDDILDHNNPKPDVTYLKDLIATLESQGWNIEDIEIGET